MKRVNLEHIITDRTLGTRGFGHTRILGSKEEHNNNRNVQKVLWNISRVVKMWLEE